MRKVLVVVGTRPNFVKVARLKQVASEHGGLEVTLVHTGQHHDDRMSAVFFRQFGLRPDLELSIPDGSQAARIGHVVIGLDAILRQHRPDAVMVVGDVDSTLAGAIAANKSGLCLVHMESGLRSGDMDMPEEVNRILTDRISAHCLVTEPSGVRNLISEGKAEESIHMVGNTMIDTLIAYDAQIAGSNVLDRLGIPAGGHVLMTMHRPGNVDSAVQLSQVIDLVAMVAGWRHVVFPVHPRTKRSLDGHGLFGRLSDVKNVSLSEPLGYFDFQQLIAKSSLVITDSGGVQEETTFRKVPCLTLRPSTERPVTVDQGTNTLVTFEKEELAVELGRIDQGTYKQGRVPDLWDGHATERVIEVLARLL